MSKKMRVNQLLDVLDSSQTIELWTCGQHIHTITPKMYQMNVLGSIVDYRVHKIEIIENGNVFKVWFVQGDEL